MLDSLIFDVCYRVPVRKIVLKNDYYYLSNPSVTIPEKHIQELLEKEFVKKNVYGGLNVTNECKSYSETLVKHLRKPNPEHPGKMIDYCEVPEEYKGE